MQAILGDIFTGIGNIFIGALAMLTVLALVIPIFFEVSKRRKSKARPRR